jgi:hypothetical protein
VERRGWVGWGRGLAGRVVSPTCCLGQRSAASREAQIEVRRAAARRLRCADDAGPPHDVRHRPHERDVEDVQCLC